MRAPLSWLRDFAPFDQPVEVLTDALSNLGLVVEGLTRVGGGLDGVVVARVLNIRAHPGADRFRLVDVDAGLGEPQQIACGATNFAVGDLVPLATIGTVLPNGAVIARQLMRGAQSNGMLCAAEEIGLPASDGPDGLLILPAGLAPPGTPIVDALQLTPDVVFDLEISPNRPDASCMAGVARDLAAALGVPWSMPTGLPWAAGASDGPGPTQRLEVVTGGRAATVEVEAKQLCPRFTATVIEGVTVAPSPPALARRLTLAGMRPINNIVDISNYVMLDVGQPNHAYDLDRLAGGGLIVRTGRPAEVLVTLDGVARTVGPEDCVICDAESTPVGIGGIMGGASSEISATTTTIVLEAAWFDPLAVARTGNRLGLHSEARVRFQHGVDPEIAGPAIDRFLHLLAAATPTGGLLRRGATVDVRSAGLPGPIRVDVRPERVNRLLGTALTPAAMVGLLAPIGFAHRPETDREAAEDTRGGPAQGDDEAGCPPALTIEIPTWRPDSTREVDVIEEIARLHGYRHIARTLPAGPRTGAGLTGYQRQRRQVRDILAGAGLSEAWTTTFLAREDLLRAGLEPAAVEIENPLDQAQSLLRPALLPGLLKAVRFNTDRQQSEVRLFEIGRCFTPTGTKNEDPSTNGGSAPGQPGGSAPGQRSGSAPGQRSGATPSEREDVAIICAGEGVDGRWAARLWAVLARALRLQGVALEAAAVPGLHPTRAANLIADGGDVAAPRRPIGALGEVDPDVVGAWGLSGRVAYLTVDVEALLAQPRMPAQARPVSRFPASDLDLALVVPDHVPAAAVDATLRHAGGDLLESLTLFDVYRGDGLGAERRSLAFRLRFRAPDRTLTEAELAGLRQAEIAAVGEAHGAVLRS